YVWREDRVDGLLARECSTALYVSGTVSNQGRFYPRFDAVVLLTAPADVLLDRIENRTTNPYGRGPPRLLAQQGPNHDDDDLRLNRLRGDDWGGGSRGRYPGRPPAIGSGA